MGTKAWGPHMWYTLHYVALGYPSKPTDAEKKGYGRFFNSLTFAIPCKICAQHYKDKLNQVPIERYLESSKSLFAWTVHLHNEVNKSTGKPIWSVKKAYNYYTGKLIEKQKQGNTFLYAMLITVIIVIIITLFTYTHAI